MKKVKLISYSIIGIFILVLQSCVPESKGTLSQVDQNIYFGKLNLSQEDIAKLLDPKQVVTYKLYTVPVLIGCETDEHIGDQTAKDEKIDDHHGNNDNGKTQEPKMKDMFIGADLLTMLISTASNTPEFLNHTYVKYTGSSQPYIIGLRIDLLDKTPLEKITVYTSGEADATISTIKPPVKTATVDSSKKGVSSKVDSTSTVSKSDTAGKKPTTGSPGGRRR